MVHINGVLLVLSSVILAGISAPAVHEHVDCAESHPAVERVVLNERAVGLNVALEERQHAEEEEEEEGSGLEERQHVQEAEYEEEASHLQVHQSAKAAAQETEDIKVVAKSGAAAVNKIINYLQNVAMDAAVLDRSVAAVTRRLTVPQGLDIQRQFASLSLILTQGARVIRTARPLTSVESRQLLGSLQDLEENFLDLLATTMAKKTTFAKLPFNIMPFIRAALKNLGSTTDDFVLALEGVVGPNARQTVATYRKTLSRAFAKALIAYS